ncbi:hypothetical protein ACXYMO_09995 [Arenibacterium sp. CAU 1754]
MKFKFWIAAALLAQPAYADTAEYASDAFGLIPVSAFAGTPRATWSGLQETVTANGAQKSTVLPAGGAETILAFVGPKSAVAGKDKVHAVALGLDRNGNMVSSGTTITFALDQDLRRKGEIRLGVAGTLFTPPPKTGVFHAGARIGDRQSARAEYRVVPDLDSVSPVMEPQPQFVQPESFADIRTTPLHDGFGNAIGDGIALQVWLDHRDGTKTMSTALTVADAGRARLLTRGTASPATMRVDLGRKKSHPITFSVRPQRIEAAPEVRATELRTIGALRLHVGPFLTDAGHVLNDGTPVHVSVRFTGQPAMTYQGWLLDGTLEAIVPGRVGDLPADIEIATETGQFRQRLTALDGQGHRQDWGLE